MEEKRLYEMYLNEAIEEKRIDLLDKNLGYKKLKKEFDKIMNAYPKLQNLLEENIRVSLDEDECKMLQKLINIYMNMQDYEEKDIFLLGCKEMFLYLKDVGLIKEK